MSVLLVDRACRCETLRDTEPQWLVHVKKNDSCYCCSWNACSAVECVGGPRVPPCITRAPGEIKMFFRR